MSSSSWIGMVSVALVAAAPLLLSVLLAATPSQANVQIEDPRTAVPSQALSPPPPFGRAMLSEFMMAPTYRNMNFGSFGTMPRRVMEAQQRYTAEMEARPDVWFRSQYKKLVQESRRQLAEMTNADSVDNLVQVENASSGVNAVLRSMLFRPRQDGDRDTVLYLNLAYGMVKDTLLWLSKRDPHLTLLQVNITLPLVHGDDSDFLRPVEEALKRHGSRIKIASFSHISSVPAIIVPIEKLASLCKSYGVEAVMVDGAHALGHHPIDLQRIAASGVDFYVANGHKWLYSPKGSAILWISPKWQAKFQTVPAVIGSTGAWDVPGEFEYTGTRDYTAFCAMQDAIAFRKWLGGEEAIMSYNRQLAWDGAQLLVRMWGSDSRTMAPQHMTAALVDVRLPNAPHDKLASLSARLLERFDTYLIVYQHPAPDGPWWTRLSAQIFLELADFEAVGRQVLELLA